MTEKERMDAGMLYICEDDNIMKVQLKHLEKLYDFNETRPSQLQLRDTLLREMFAEIGEDCYIEPPLRANWAVHMFISAIMYMLILT